jgi:hypothetical protein
MDELYYKKLHGPYSSAGFIRVIRARKIERVKHVIHMGEKGNAFRVLVVKPE